MDHWCRGQCQRGGGVAAQCGGGGGNLVLEENDGIVVAYSGLEQSAVVGGRVRANDFEESI
jgi:hypothetical protein